MGVERWSPVVEGRFHLRNIGARTVTEWCRHLYCYANDAELAEHEKRVRRVMKLAQRQAKHFAGKRQ